MIKNKSANKFRKALWHRLKEKDSWLKTFPELSINKIDSLIQSLSSYESKGLNAGGINEALMNVVMQQNLPSYISKTRNNLPQIKKALEKALRLAKELDGDDFILHFPNRLASCLECLNEIEKRIKFYDDKMVRRGNKTKRPLLKSLHLAEGELVAYFLDSGYCKTKESAYQETLKLLKTVGRLITKKQLSDNYRLCKKDKNFFGSYNIRYYGLFPESKK